jgi:hypothetical protein
VWSGSTLVTTCSSKVEKWYEFHKKNVNRRSQVSQEHTNTVCGGYTEAQGSWGFFYWGGKPGRFRFHDVPHWLKVYQVWVHHPMSPYTPLDHQQGPTGAGIYHYHFRRIVPHAGDGKIQVVEWLSTQENQQQHFQVSRKYRVRHNTHQGCGQQDSSGKYFQLQRIQDHSLKVLKTDVKGSKCNNCDGCVIHSVVSPQ